MFKLIKILGGRINVAEERKIKVTALGAAIEAGTPVNIAAGVVTVLTASTTARATHVVSHPAASGATEVIVFDLNPSMVFETVLNAADSTPVCLIGSECKITKDGVNAAVVASSVRGAVIFETPASTASGAPIKVIFPAS